MSIGMGHESGLRDVPEETFIRSMPAGFMSCPNAGTTNRMKLAVLKSMGLQEEDLFSH
jgi:hypothetical protein